MQCIITENNQHTIMNQIKWLSTQPTVRARENPCYSIGIGVKSQVLSSVAPQEHKLGYYYQSGTNLGASETHASFLWSIFYKWPVINVPGLTLK